MRLLQFCLLAFLTLGHVMSAAADRAQVLKVVEAALADPEDDAAFKAYLALLPKVQNPLAKEFDFYLVEGDMPMTEKQVRVYLRSKSAAPIIAGQDNSELIVNTVAGKPTFWDKPEKRTLKYAVMRASFRDQAKYDMVLKDMAASTDEWTAACPGCGIKFVHVAEFDKLDDPLGYIPHLENDDIRFVVIFSDVTAANSANAYIARSLSVLWI